MKCWVKWGKEGKGYGLLGGVGGGSERRVGVIKWRKVGMR